VRALRREFLQLQAVAHPDRQPDARLKARAEAASARINEAYRTLGAPLARAQYLLALAGRDVANDETAKTADPELLMEVLDAREQIEDAGDDEHALDALREENALRERESIDVLARCFRDGDLDAAVREAARLRYWVNIRETIDNWEPGKPVVLEH
jgi:molecular chaperone HscB